MKMILNWTLGSFFRTIGKIFALIFIGFILLLLFGNVKAFTLKDKYMEFETYGHCSYLAPLSCQSYISTNPNGSITLPNSSYFKDYYFLYQDTYSSGTSSNNPKYFIYTQDTPFFIVLRFEYGSFASTYTSVTPYSARIEISQDLYQQYYNNGYKSRLYYDTDNNKYYYFTNELLGMTENVPKYIINSNDWGVNPAGTAGTYLLAQNIDNVYYYSSSQNSNGTLKKLPSTLNNNIYSYNVTFHLNGGTAITLGNSDCDLSDDNCNFLTNSTSYYNDFTLSFGDNLELQSFIGRTSIKNDFVTFNQWYYDEQLTQPYNSNNTLNSDINLYASYEYTSVDSVINNINFNQYTFNSPNDDYEYAVISVKENFSQGMYIGLDFNFQYLDSYRYIISDNAFEEGIAIHLKSIGSKDNKYYYHLGHLNNDTSMVVVIDKANLITLGVNNELEHYYDFLVSDNCYVYFTNDLTQVSYYLPSGTLLQNQDISKNYDYTQKIILDNNSDIITKFISLINNGDFSIFNFVTTLWAKIRAYKILNYFMIISLGGIIIALIKGGSRH